MQDLTPEERAKLAPAIDALAAMFDDMAAYSRKLAGMMRDGTSVDEIEKTVGVFDEKMQAAMKVVSSMETP